MGKTYDALRRAQATRDARFGSGDVQPPSAHPGSGRRLWRRLRGGPAQEAEGVEALPARPAPPDPADEILARIDALDERLEKRLPELEQRLLHLVDARSRALEQQLAERLRAALPTDSLERLTRLAQLLTVFVWASAAVAAGLLLRAAFG